MVWLEALRQLIPLANYAMNGRPGPGKNRLVQVGPGSRAAWSIILSSGKQLLYS